MQFVILLMTVNVTACKNSNARNVHYRIRGICVFASSTDAAQSGRYVDLRLHRYDTVTVNR
jgi:hypothetical protein